MPSDQTSDRQRAREMSQILQLSILAIYLTLMMPGQVENMAINLEDEDILTGQRMAETNKLDDNTRRPEVPMFGRILRTGTGEATEIIPGRDPGKVWWRM